MTCSGTMYAGVPSAVPTSVSVCTTCGPLKSCHEPTSRSMPHAGPSAASSRSCSRAGSVPTLRTSQTLAWRNYGQAVLRNRCGPMTPAAPGTGARDCHRASNPPAPVSTRGPATFSLRGFHLGSCWRVFWCEFAQRRSRSARASRRSIVIRVPNDLSDRAPRRLSDHDADDVTGERSAGYR
jgi:hypothetical protein